jgi:ATP-dependent DNA ligase
VPTGERWLHEIKFDGYRVQLHLANETVRVFTRRFPDFTARFRMRFSLGLANAKACCFSSSASAENASTPMLAVAAPKL